MENIDKFVQCDIKSKTYDSSNGFEYGFKYGIGCGSGHAVGYPDDDTYTGFGEYYDHTNPFMKGEGDGGACGYGYKNNTGGGNFETNNLYEKHK